MSERGVVAMDRGIFTDTDFADEPLTEREAFMWLVAEAAWKPHDKRIGAHVIHLDRGQVAASIRFMAEAWKWSKSRVDRFLKRLQNRDTIGTHARDSLTVVTIRKYDDFQIGRPKAGQSRDSEPGQSRDKLESRETEKVVVGSARVLSLDLEAEFTHAFWPEYPNKVGKRAALKAYKAARERANLQEILDGLKRYKASKPVRQAWCNPSTFLNQDRWTDEPSYPDERPPSGGKRLSGHGALFAALAESCADGSQRDEREASSDFFGGGPEQEPEARDRNKVVEFRPGDGGWSLGEECEGDRRSHGDVPGRRWG